MNIDLKNTLALAVEWAKEVGEVQRSYFRSGHLELETKSTVHDVVTKVDKLSESMLIERIGKCFLIIACWGKRVGNMMLIAIICGWWILWTGQIIIVRDYQCFACLSGCNTGERRYWG